MTVFAQKDYFSKEEYFCISEQSLEKLEYFDGKIIPSTGGTATHNEICANAIFAIGSALKKSKKKYRLYTSDMKIQIEKQNRFVYPDAVVVCEVPEFYDGRKDIIVNPVLIVEVLSPGTEEYDRNGKFESYRHLPSFIEYVNISQKRIELSTFFKEAEDLWRTTDYESIEDIVTLKSIDCKITLQDIYDGIEFEKEKK